MAIQPFPPEMSEPKESFRVEHYVFINNVIGRLVESYASFFKNQLFDRSTEVVIGTYEKAVQLFNNRRTEAGSAGEKFHPKFPFITFDPGLDFEPEERAGKFFYQYPHHMARYASQEFKPAIYEDDNLIIGPVLNRYKGRLEMILWCSSVYEQIDYRMMLYQFFGGIGRQITPRTIEGYIILPDNFVYYTYTNKFKGITYELDWSGTSVGVTLVKNINRDKYVFPFKVTPWLTLTDVSDGSEKYGADDISDWRLTASMEWECSIPTHLVMHAYQIPEQIYKSTFEMDSGFHWVDATDDPSAPQTRTVSITDDEGIPRTHDIKYHSAYNYILTESDKTTLEAENNITITLPVAIDIPDYLLVYSKYGRLYERYHWKRNETNVTDIEIIGYGVSGFEKDDILTFVVYEVGE